MYNRPRPINYAEDDSDAVINNYLYFTAPALPLAFRVCDDFLTVVYFLLSSYYRLSMRVL